MKFLESVSSFWSKAVEFNGIASRSEYWWTQLFLFCCDVLILGFSQSENQETMLFLYDVVTFIPCMTLTVRRFNDVKLPIWIPIVALSMSLFFDILSFVTDESDILDFLSISIGIFIFGVCLAPSANKTIKKD